MSQYRVLFLFTLTILLMLLKATAYGAAHLGRKVVLSLQIPS